ncbi:MAG: hypothetical protein H7062_04740, partial [Candidatus Saccharimonas sp.]|nr:hypothetical protein [Planctomycetaceae bacterium]
MFTSRLSLVRWLWTHNPFYFISALLMLYAVRAGYGEQNIGTINCWLMMGVLAGYTLVLSAIGVLIVRYGKVWEDARSILLLLLLLFLAVSVSADDLFVKMESSSGGAALLGFGFLFSVAVMLLTLRGAGIRLGAAYLVPFVLFLALFYVMPWWCSPELNPRHEPKKVDWMLFLIPQAAALLCLTLLPAVRLGRAYTANNGTPWPWPWFPWTAFGMIVTAMALRSYALTLTFSPTGMIWVSPDSRFGIVLDTIWRPYFLVPFALANLVLILEAGLVSGNARLVRRALLAVPGVMLMAWPWYQTGVMLDFLTRLTVTVASPVWLAVWLMVLFYGWALLRRAAGAEIGLLGSSLLFSVIGPQTIGLSTLAVVNPLPLLGVSVIFAVMGLRRRSSAITMTAALLMTLSVWFLLPSTPLAAYRMTVCYHALFAAVLLLGLFHRDALAQLLRHAGAILLPLTAFVALAAPAAVEVPLLWRLLYIAGLVGAAYVCAHISRSRSFWTGFGGTSFLLGYGLTTVIYREAASHV